MSEINGLKTRNGGTIAKIHKNYKLKLRKIDFSLEKIDQKDKYRQIFDSPRRAL